MPENPIEFPQLLPPLGDELSADQALDAANQQAFESPESSDDVLSPEVQPYGLTWQWDFAKGRFVDYGGTPAVVRDLDNLRIWAETVYNIQRHAHEIFDEDIGVEGSMMIGDLVDDVASQELYMQAMFDALMVHDRISNVTNFDFDVDTTDPESSYVYFEIHTDGGDVLPVTLAAQETD